MEGKERGKKGRTGEEEGRMEGKGDTLEKSDK